MRETILGLLALALVCAPTARADSNGAPPCAGSFDWTLPVRAQELGLVQLLAVPTAKPDEVELVPVVVTKVAPSGQKSSKIAFKVYTFAPHAPIVPQSKAGHSPMPEATLIEPSPAYVVTIGKKGTGEPPLATATATPLPTDITGNIAKGGSATVRVGDVFQSRGHVEMGGVERSHGIMITADNELSVARVRIGKDGPWLAALVHAGGGFESTNLLSGKVFYADVGAGASLTIPTRDRTNPVRIFAVGGPGYTVRAFGTPLKESSTGPAFSAGVEYLFF